MTQTAIRPARSRTDPTTTTTTAVDGLLDVVDDKAWIRTNGYLPGPGDIPLPAAEVRRHGLRRGHHVTGVFRHEGRKLVTLDGPQDRPDFYRLTPLHPAERLRLENGDLTTRVIDLVMPIGKGQRALIVAPPKAGKTTVLRQIAAGISHNHPECHLMVLLVGERPEEVTDIRRTVRGEVVAATFDHTPREQTAIAELAVERAKRLVENGQDVVLLIDSVTRLGRAYNLAAPGRGRTLSGGMDASALHPPKQLLGAARNIENGGSLTILATALVETGSAMDGLIHEELKSTGNADLKLDRGLAEARIFPAIDVAASGTRHDEALLPAGELAVVAQVRRAIAGQRDGMEQLLKQLRTTPSNAAFLHRIQASLPYA
ncbi:putative ATP synthase alpha/beta family nucleotide-binding domain protein [Actinoplanes missouriensis 431]|uniref:Transcription termination factor Rho n=1 Tax=Actinoplanes missouriensis (strain ATCC 14538 / DSM 43046 / CBS 188.64 / JCM 3121 / NBRC 102363 / NCIMB 12654 / NRRL B-3342 / UNCC 431) TaxID=512565 RepID=I0H7E6_ACTM4|nr:transcription termination factor Rho [Actinoplanes missouriensis]BAL88933.1 putative ATP synthase alpha/beta family nucleotide-binding domain protein [Actinoplanes missouriensis 431]